MTSSKNPGKQRFAPVPSRALSDSRLTALDHRVLEAIACHDRFSRNGIGCSASHKRIGALVGAHLTNVSKSIAKLIRFGYLTAHKSGGDGRRRIYQVIYNDEDANVFASDFTNRKLARHAKFQAESNEIDGADKPLNPCKELTSNTVIYSPNEEYNKIDPIKNSAAAGYATSSQAQGRQRQLATLITQATGKVSTNAMEATDRINREIDAATEHPSGCETSTTPATKSSAVPSSQLLNSSLCRKARSES